LRHDGRAMRAVYLGFSADMIDPQLEDCWARRRRTHIRYQDSTLSGAGVSLQVILPAFGASELIWYTVIYGGFDDNLLLLGCDRNEAAHFEQIQYGETSPVRTLYSGDFPNEYVLTDEIRLALGIRLEEDSLSIDQKERIACQVYIHDNCFFWIEPMNADLLGRVFGCILEQHSFYLGQEIDWSGISPELIRRLVSLGELELQSDPKRQCLWIPQLEARRGFFWKWFREGTVLIENGKACMKTGHP
jgi:hypothetical protein